MVWREEELLATEILANILQGYGHFYMISRGRNIPTVQTIHRLMFESHKKKVYLSFPMSHVNSVSVSLASLRSQPANVACTCELEGTSMDNHYNNTEGPICDFCSSPEPGWTLPMLGPT